MDRRREDERGGGFVGTGTEAGIGLLLDNLAPGIAMGMGVGAGLAACDGGGDG